MFALSASVGTAKAAAETIESARTIVRALITTPPTVAEFENARNVLRAELKRASEQPDALAEKWLDEQTYFSGTANAVDASRTLESLTPADIQRVAARIFRDGQVASVVVGDGAQLRDEMARTGGVEFRGVDDANPPQATKTPAPLEQK